MFDLFLSELSECNEFPHTWYPFSDFRVFSNYPKCSDTMSQAKRKDPDQRLQNLTSDRSTLFATHSTILEIPVGYQMAMFKFKDKWAKDVWISHHENMPMYFWSL